MTENRMDRQGPLLAAEQAVLAVPSGAALPKAVPLQEVKEPFRADPVDAAFALFAFVLGFFFARWVLPYWQGWGVTVFTLGYCGSVVVYLWRKGQRFSRASWFWLGVVILTGLSFSLWNNYSLEPWRNLLLFCSAVYWVISATNVLALGKTSNWLVLDGLNALFGIPFKNFGTQYKSLALYNKSKDGGKQLLSIGLGLLLTLIVGAAVFPLLRAADSGGFAQLTDGLVKFLPQGEMAELIVQGILAIPIAAYIFGLVAGSTHKRGCVMFPQEKMEKSTVAMRVLPLATIYTLLGLLCTLYVVFIGSQLPYFFSAFAGERPEGWLVYSEYARRGFFELCGIAFINLTVLTAVNCLGQRKAHDSTVLKILNILLAVLTLVLIATAMSKMALYIGAYGLSVQRLLPCVFMIFLAVVYGGVIALQKWNFSIVRLAAVTGVVMLCTLCLADPDGLVARYNAQRYLAGTLSNFDVSILYRSGPAGVEPALQVYAQTKDQDLLFELQQYLDYQQKRAAKSLGTSRDNWQNICARQKIAGFAAR